MSRTGDEPSVIIGNLNIDELGFTSRDSWVPISDKLQFFLQLREIVDISIYWGLNFNSGYLGLGIY